VVDFCEHGNKMLVLQCGEFLGWLGGLILLVIVCLPICYSTTIATLGLVIRTPATFLCKFRRMQ
jgi:hypothetical protein